MIYFHSEKHKSLTSFTKKKKTTTKRNSKQRLNLTMDLKEKILQELQQHGKFLTKDFAAKFGYDHDSVIGAMKSLEHVPPGNLTCVLEEERNWVVEKAGLDILKDGSPEYKLFEAIGTSGKTRDELSDLGLSDAFKNAAANGWCVMGKDGLVTRKIAIATDIAKQVCEIVQKTSSIDSVNPKDLKAIVKRKLIKESKSTWFDVNKGPNFTAIQKKICKDLTEDLIKSGEWMNSEFKNYTFIGQPPITGHFHPLLKVRAQYRAKFLEMGFTEMPTNNYVESSFWNFDALFQPQQHPARDAHDTFFLKDPAQTLLIPEDYMQIVKETHENGGSTGSIGYGYKWSLDEAKKNLLRTHTTAVSSRMLKKLAGETPFKPAKFFSIDRVFRNESMDATHLCEFSQIEGVVADYNLTLGDLIGTLYEFFNKLGIKKLRFKPAYNPYTEPSMEIFSYHDGLKKWVEIGNSGMFRPEMLEPMGLPKDVTVIAWGLSLERPTMIMYGFNNIRDLVGHKCDLDMIKSLPICSL